MHLHINNLVIFCLRILHLKLFVLIYLLTSNLMIFLIFKLLGENICTDVLALQMNIKVSTYVITAESLYIS